MTFKGVVLTVVAIFLYFMFSGISNNNYRIKTINGWRTRKAGDAGLFVLIFIVCAVLSKCMSAVGL